jgi:nucleotide-binding universal stress UspA family protein
MSSNVTAGVDRYGARRDPVADHPVVACSSGPDSSGAVELGARLAAALHQSLVVASAYRYEPVAFGPRPVPTRWNEVRFDAAQARVERAERLVPAGVEVHERVVPAEDVAEALAALAREVDACALAVGRDADGHVTRSLLEHAPCPVAVSPFTVPVLGEEPFRTIGVAYDGSPGARFALAAAMRLATRTGARMEVITVGPPADAVAADAADLLSEAVHVDVRRLAGDPRARLVEASDGLDLLVCGSRGRGRVLAAVLGSVSGRLVQAAHCTVLVVAPRLRRRATAPLGLTTAGG